MSDSSPVPTPTPPLRTTTPTRVFAITAALAVIAGGVFGVIYFQNQDIPPVDTMKALKTYIGEVDRFSKLDAAYADANADLLADEPKDAAKFVNPAELKFTVVVFDDPDKAEQTWKPLMDQLAKATGKSVSYLKRIPGSPAAPPAPPAPKSDDEDAPPPGDPYGLRNLDQQLATLRDGKLHVTAFSTGAVAQAVNTGGFVPMFAPANDAGHFSYEMEIIVPASSAVQKPEDLKGKTIAFTGMSSNSGANAPLVALKQEFNLLPDRDYNFVLTGDHKRSILDLVAGKHAAACVANDILGQMIESGEVKKEAVRSIYKSKPFPPLCFGVSANLDPKLKAAVKAAFETFAFAGNSVGERFKAQKRVKFVGVDYKKDFEFVRDVDAKLAKFLEK